MPKYWKQSMFLNYWLMILKNWIQSVFPNYWYLLLSSFASLNHGWWLTHMIHSSKLQCNYYVTYCHNVICQKHWRQLPAQKIQSKFWRRCVALTSFSAATGLSAFLLLLYGFLYVCSVDVTIHYYSYTDICSLYLLLIRFMSLIYTVFNWRSRSRQLVKKWWSSEVMNKCSSHLQ